MLSRKKNSLNKVAYQFYLHYKMLINLALTTFCLFAPPAPKGERLPSLEKKAGCGSPLGAGGERRKSTNPFFKTILAVFLLFLSAPLSAQNTISSSQVLSSSKNELTVLLEDKKIDFLKNTNHNMPISDELEYRTELDEMNFQEQEHTLRWRFTGIKERKAQKKYHQATINLHETEKQLVFEEILFDRYSTLVNYFHQKKEINIRQQQQLVLEDKLNIMRTLASQTTDFDIEDLIRAEDDWHELQVDIFELQEQISSIENRFSKKLNYFTNTPIDTNGLLNIKQLQSITNQFSDTSIFNLGISERQARIDHTAAEYNLEKAEAQQTFDFLQLRYQDRDQKLSIEEEWSLGIGLQIPLKNANRLRLNELELQRIEDENRLLNYRENLAKRIIQTKRDLAFLFAQYELVQQQLENSHAKYSFGEYRKLYGSEPLALLNMKESLLKREMTLIRIEEDIFREYIRLLDLTGVLYEVPLRNYLLKGLDSF